MTRSPDFSTRAVRLAGGPAHLLLLALAAVSLAASVALAWSAGARLRRARGEAAQARLDARRAVEGGRALRSGAAADSLASRAFLTAEAPPPRVLADLEAVLPKDVRLDGLTLSYGPQLELDLVVAARRGSAYDEFLGRLLASRSFADVVPEAETRDGEVKATISASYRGAAGP